MFPTVNRLATCLNQDALCRCDICLPFHCPDCADNFADINAYHLHIRRPSQKHSCAYCKGKFIRRGDLIQHYESNSCRTPFNRFVDRFLIDRYEAGYNLYNDVAVILGYRSGPPPGPALATEQSLHVGINSYKCYLCKPTSMAFPYLNMLNNHLSSHREELFKCPHTACNRPFNTIGGLVQHIETRSCRCMADSNWWTTYFILTETNKKSQRVKENPCLEVRLEVVELLELFDYWVDVYGEMTCDDGCWVYKRYTLRSWARGVAWFLTVHCIIWTIFVGFVLLLTTGVFDVPKL